MSRVIEYRRPPLYALQERAIFGPSRFSIVEASTKSGKTVGCIAWIVEQAAIGGGPNKNYWWVAPTHGVADIAFRRAKVGIPTAFYTANESRSIITLANGANIWFKSAEKPDHLYGEDVCGFVFDEATRCKEEAWHALRSTITATRAKGRFIGNVKGRRNWVYKLARKAEADMAAGHPVPRWEYHKITAWDAVAAGVLEMEEIEQAKSELPEDVFKELYECIASDDGGNPFGFQWIAKATMPCMSEEPPVCWGWDLGKSVDFTVGIGLDRYRKVCRFHRFQRPWKETIRVIRNLTNGAPAYVDATGVGDVVMEFFQDPEEKTILLKHAHEGGEFVEPRKLTTFGENFEGFVFTSRSKQMLMETLAIAIQDENAYTRLGFPVGIIVNELESFEYEHTRTGIRYGAPEGFHDDAVCSLAMANLSYKKRPAELIVA